MDNQAIQTQSSSIVSVWKPSGLRIVLTKTWIVTLPNSVSIIHNELQVKEHTHCYLSYYLCAKCSHLFHPMKVLPICNLLEFTGFVHSHQNIENMQMYS